MHGTTLLRTFTFDDFGEPLYCDFFRIARKGKSAADNQCESVPALASTLNFNSTRVAPLSKIALPLVTAVSFHPSRSSPTRSSLPSNIAVEPFPFTTVDI